jgi:hypothetical protein
MELHGAGVLRRALRDPTASFRPEPETTLRRRALETAASFRLTSGLQLDLKIA